MDRRGGGGDFPPEASLDTETNLRSKVIEVKVGAIIMVLVSKCFYHFYVLIKCFSQALIKDSLYFMVASNSLLEMYFKKGLQLGSPEKLFLIHFGPNCRLL